MINEIRKIWLVLRGQIREDIASPRLWAGYIIGCMTMMGAVEYVKYAKDRPIQICEAFLAVQGNVKIFYAMFFGLLFIVSEAPYLNARTQSVVMRITRLTWRRAMVIHTAVQSFVYITVLALFTIIISIPHAYVGNIWSNVYKQSTQLIATSNSGLIFLEATSNVLMENVSPWQCFIISWLLMSLYGCILALLVFMFNFKFSKAVGIAVALLVHLYSFAAVRGYILVSPRYIPGVFADLGTIFLYTKMGISVGYAVIFFILAALILEIIIKIFVKHSDFIF